MAPGAARFEAASDLACGACEGLRSQLPRGVGVVGAHLGVRQERVPVPVAQLAERRVRGRGVGPQQGDEPVVGRRGMGATVRKHRVLLSPGARWVLIVVQERCYG